MDVFALLFILSFIALIVTLVVMSIRKRITFSRLINKGKGDFKEEVGSTEISSSGKTYAPVVGKTTYETVWDVSSTPDRSVWSRYKQTENGVEFVDCAWSDESWMKREVNETQEKWKETVPKHSTRIKLRASRKLRNKRKGKKK